jgi:hypothetical protein
MIDDAVRKKTEKPRFWETMKKAVFEKRDCI